jgi:hypothetical protein
LLGAPLALSHLARLRETKAEEERYKPTTFTQGNHLAQSAMSREETVRKISHCPTPSHVLRKDCVHTRFSEHVKKQGGVRLLIAGQRLPGVNIGQSGVEPVIGGNDWIHPLANKSLRAPASSCLRIESTKGPIMAPFDPRLTIVYLSMDQPNDQKPVTC